MSSFETDPRRWRTLPVILLATFMASFDFMVVNVAAPSLATSLHAGQAALELVVGGYGFTYAAGMVTGGKLGDLFGHRRIFLLGLVGFTLASLLCGAAQSQGELVVARLLQGLAAAGMAPQVLALITATFLAQERPRALSWFALTISVGAISGQVLGGLLLQADLLGLGWRAIFLVNGPVGVTAFALAARLLPKREPVGRPQLDPVGALAVSVALGLALLPLVVGREQGWPLWSLLSLAAAVPALAAALGWMRLRARQGREPLLDLSLFRVRSFTVGLLVNVAMMLGFGSLMLVTTLLLQAGLGLDAVRAGLMFLPMGGATMAASLLGRRLAGHGTRILLLGNAVSSLGLVVLALELRLAGAGIAVALLALPLALVGLGSGLAMPAVMGAVLSGVRPTQAGAAAGVLATTQQFSSAAGVAILGAVFFTALGGHGHGDGHPSPAAYAHAAQLTAWLTALLWAAGTALVALLPRRADGASAPSAATAPVGAGSAARRALTRVGQGR